MIYINVQKIFKDQKIQFLEVKKHHYGKFQKMMIHLLQHIEVLMKY